MIKVLHFIPGYKYGGIEARFKEWLKYTNKYQVKFDLVVQTELSKEELEKLSYYDCTVYKVPFMNKNFLGHINEIKKIYNKNKYDIVHCHSLMGIYFLKFAKKNGIKVRILHSRTTSLDGSSFIQIRNIIKKKTIKEATDYIACSQEAGKWMFGKKNFKVILNSIDYKKFKFSNDKRNKIRSKLNISDDEMLIGHVGRFTYAKNHIFILDLINKLVKHDKKFKLLLIGDGDLKKEIENIIYKKNLKENVILLGKKDNVENYLSAMDIFIFPSLYEGFGTVLLEAQANGIKCIASENVPKSTNALNMVKYSKLDLEVWFEEILNCKPYDINFREKNYRKIENTQYGSEYTMKILNNKYYTKFKEKI